MKPKILLFLVVVVFTQCKKENTCASYEERLSKAPAADLTTNDLSKLPYYKLSSVTFAKNDTIMQTFNFIGNTTTYDPISSDGLYATCPNYYIKNQQNQLIFKNTDSNMLIIYHNIQIPTKYDSAKVRIQFKIGGFDYIVASGIIRHPAFVYGTIDSKYLDSIPNINSMIIRGKIYKNIYLSVYDYHVNGMDNSDSIYFTTTDGIIRASKYNGDVYELVK